MRRLGRAQGCSSGTAGAAGSTSTASTAGASREEEVEKLADEDRGDASARAQHGHVAAAGLVEYLEALTGRLPGSVDDERDEAGILMARHADSLRRPWLHGRSMHPLYMKLRVRHHVLGSASPKDAIFRLAHEASSLTQFRDEALENALRESPDAFAIGSEGKGEMAAVAVAIEEWLQGVALEDKARSVAIIMATDSPLRVVTIQLRRSRRAVQREALFRF